MVAFKLFCFGHRVGGRVIPAVGLVLLLATTGCDFFKKTKPEVENKESEKIPVEVASVTRGPIEMVLVSSTHLLAESEVKVISRTSNRVKELKVEEGDWVEKGGLLLVLEDREQRIQVEKADSQVTKSRQEFARQESLYQQKLISEQAYQEAAFNLRQLELSLEEARLQLDYTQVYAPIRGVVTRRLAKLGDQVSANQHLFTMTDFDTIVAEIFIPEKHLALLEPGLPVRLMAPSLGTDLVEGKVKRIAPTVDPATGTIKVTVQVPGRATLRPGLFLQVELVLSRKSNAILIPKRAVVYDGDQTFVFRLDPQTRTVSRAQVIPLLVDKEFIEPVSGFEAGDWIVMAGQTGLKEGAKVKVLNSVPGLAPETDSQETGKPAKTEP